MNLFDIFTRKRTLPEARYTMPTMTALSSAPAKSGAKSAVLDQPLPKAGKPGATTYPSVMTSAKPNTASAFQVVDSSYAATDLTTLRATATNTRDLLQKLTVASPEVSASVSAYTRVGIPREFTAVARNMDGTFNRDATALTQAILTRMNFLGNPLAQGFDDSLSLRTMCESLVRDLRVYGGCALELVLDKARLPYKFQPISYSQIKMYPTADGKSLTPKQTVAGQTIDLDIATFFMVNLDQNLLSAYPDSPLESSLQGVMFSFEFMNDIRRVVKRAIHPRYDVELDSDQFHKNVPPEIMGDSEKVILYMNQLITQIQDQMVGLAPEDAIVHFSEMGISVIDHGNTNLSNEYATIMGMINGKLATGTKTMQTIMGTGDGTANLASTETLLFVLAVESSTTYKLNEILSCGLTQAVRLMGQDVYVDFAFDRVDLRPAMEMETFKALKQSRIMELLSAGFLTDDDACMQLTGAMTPAGFTPLSGTQFFGAKAAAPGLDDGKNSSNDGSAANKALNPKTPTGGARGANQKNQRTAQP